MGKIHMFLSTIQMMLDQMNECIDNEPSHIFMFKNDKPRVSLGIPIFNESKYISETVNSLINQTYENIEIIAIDNDSNDDSFRILESLSKQDNRLKIFKNTKNIGMSENFNLVFKKSTGKYFAWIGAHDIYEKKFVEK